MDNSDTDHFDCMNLPNNFLGKRFSPLMMDHTGSQRGSSFDIEECMNNMNSISNINPRFAVEIDTFTLTYSRS